MCYLKVLELREPHSLGSCYETKFSLANSNWPSIKHRWAMFLSLRSPDCRAPSTRPQGTDLTRGGGEAPWPPKVLKLYQSHLPTMLPIQGPSTKRLKVPWGPGSGLCYSLPHTSYPEPCPNIDDLCNEWMSGPPKKRGQWWMLNGNHVACLSIIW